MKDYKLSTKNLWLVKPPDSDQGRGIYLMEKPEDVCSNCIVNRYIANPHLLNKKKYDLRVYVLITSFNPLIVYVYNDGLVRLCVDDYTISLESLKNLYIHLTNTSLNDKSEKFKINNDLLGYVLRGIDVFGIKGLNNLYAFMIARELIDVQKRIKANMTKESKKLLDQFAESLYPFDTLTKNASTIYNNTLKETKKLWIPLFESLCRIGQIQLFKRKLIFNFKSLLPIRF